MKNNVFGALLLIVLISCSVTTSSIVDTKPPIILTTSTDFPAICSEIVVGDAFELNYRFTDNEELGGYSIEVHNNFDHHTHSTEKVDGDCELDAKKDADNPLRINDVGNIPSGMTSYQVKKEYEVKSDVDTGDYDFIIRVTDKSGFEFIRIIPIKVVAKTEE